MAKCAICDSRKGQRTCKMAGAMVCSICCGQHRQKEACQGCTYYRDVPIKPTRDYRDVPRYSTQTMEDDLELQSYAHMIESALCLWDRLMNGTLNDNSALRVLERLLDRCYFKDDTADTLEEPLRRGFEIVWSAINEDLADISNDKLVKILGVIYFVARRRARGGRDYFHVIHQYVGLRLGPGMRILNL